MRWLFRTLWLLLVLGLFALAALPYIQTLRELAQDFAQAWTLVRSEAPAEETTPAPQAEPEAKARPQLTLPAEETPEAGSPKDPFLAEASERAAADPKAAMQWLLDEAPPEDRLRGMLAVVAVWAASDSPAALLWLEENAAGIARGETLHQGITLWSQQDPQAAADWIEGMANDPGKTTAIDALLRNWATTRPQAAADWVDRMPIGPIRRQAANTLVDALLQNDPARAAQWAFSEAVEQDHPELLEHGIAQWTQTDPAAAETYLRQIDAGTTVPDAVQSYLQTLTQQDPQKAADWLQTLNPQDPLYQNNLNSTLLQEWSRSDSIAASAWLGQADPGPARDAAIVGFATTMIDYEPAAVAEWTSAIDDPQTRNNWLTHTLQIWSRSEPSEAREWLLRTELDPTLREQLNREINQSQGSVPLRLRNH